MIISISRCLTNCRKLVNAGPLERVSLEAIPVRAFGNNWLTSSSILSTPALRPPKNPQRRIQDNESVLLHCTRSGGIADGILTYVPLTKPSSLDIHFCIRKPYKYLRVRILVYLEKVKPVRRVRVLLGLPFEA